MTIQDMIAIAFSVWLVISSALTFKKAAALGKRSVSKDERIRCAVPAVLNYTAAIMVSAGIYLGVGPYLLGNDLTWIYVFVGALFLSTTVDTVVAFVYPGDGELSRAKLASPILTLLIGGAFFIYILFILSAPGSDADSVHLAYPVKGTWEVWGGGRTGWTNYNHHDNARQTYAVDMVCLSGKTEGQELYAPIEGKIMEAVNDETDTEEGNLVIIECANGTQVWMAHLMERSIVVHKGDRVARGQLLAKCGDTGRNTASAHLHIHAQAGEKAVPMLMQNKFLVRADKFTAN